MLFTRRSNRFVAEEVVPDATRRGLLAGACACAAFALIGRDAARAQSKRAAAPRPARPIHAALDEAVRGIEQR